MLEDMLLDLANARSTDDVKKALNRLARIGVDAVTARILVRELASERDKARERCAR